MGILDDAIKEHLELKRQHGAGESELKKLEDEAFGASERPGDEASAPDAVAEAPTQFMTQPDLDAPRKESDASEDHGPEAEAPEDAADAAPAPDEPSGRGRTEIADLQEPPAESADATDQAAADEPSPAMEHEAVVEPEALEEQQPEPPAGPSTEERHAIAEQPTEMYDVEAELGDSEAGDVEAQLADAEPPDAEPVVQAAAEEDLSEEDEEFWDEKRLSDELDQALEAPVELQEPEITEAPESVAQPEPAEDREQSDEAEAPEPEPPAAEERPAERSGKQDVLDETPDFLEEKPEDADLWFEQKPPKDFDFDD